MKKNRLSILVVAAHPDDEILGCGGTIARHAQAGDHVSILILGEGVTSRYKNREISNKQKLQDLKIQARDASRIIGAKKIFFSDFPDNSFDSVSILKIIKEIERIKNIVRPNIVYTHHYGDLNIDHKITYEAVLTASRPFKNETVKEIYSFAVPSSTEWAGIDRKTYFIPDKFVDISKTIDKKIEALKCYKGEMREYPHPRSIKGVKIFAGKYGLEVGLKYSEPFQTIRMVII